MTFEEIQIGKTYTWKKSLLETDFEPEERDLECTYTVIGKDFLPQDILAIENHPHDGKTETRWSFAYVDWEEVIVRTLDVELII